MALTLTSDSATIGTTEYWLASDSTTKVDQTADVSLQAFIDFGNMALGDRYQVRVVEKVNAGTQRNVGQPIILEGVQSSLLVVPSLILGEGWEVGVQKLAGTDRSIGWSLRKVS